MSQPRDVLPAPRTVPVEVAIERAVNVFRLKTCASCYRDQAADFEARLKTALGRR